MQWNVKPEARKMWLYEETAWLTSMAQFEELEIVELLPKTSA